MITIESKTDLLPFIIAQNAIWELCEEKFNQLDNEQIIKHIEALEPVLIERANLLYKTNKQFKKGITNNEKGRNKLYMWFKHWSEAEIIKNINTKN